MSECVSPIVVNPAAAVVIIALVTIYGLPLVMLSLITLWEERQNVGEWFIAIFYQLFRGGC